MARVRGQNYGSTEASFSSDAVARWRNSRSEASAGKVAMQTCEMRNDMIINAI